MAFARDRGSPDLKIPDPTKQPSTCGPKFLVREIEHSPYSKLHHQCNICGCCNSTCSKSHNWKPAKFTSLFHQMKGALVLLGKNKDLSKWVGFLESKHSATSSSSIVFKRRISLKISLVWRTASTMLPVPAFPFILIMLAPSPILRSASPRFFAPQTKGTSNLVLLMWCSVSAAVRTSLSSKKCLVTKLLNF